MAPKHGTKTGCKSAPAIAKDKAQISHKRIGSIGDETAPKRTHHSQLLQPRMRMSRRRRKMERNLSQL